MKSVQTVRKKGHYVGQKEIIRFRSSSDLHDRLKNLAEDEELCLAALVRKLVTDRLQQFPPKDTSS
jgi:hypothetical protein